MPKFGGAVAGKAMLYTEAGGGAQVDAHIPDS